MEAGETAGEGTPATSARISPALIDKNLLGATQTCNCTASASFSAKASQDDLPKGNAAVSDPATYR